MVFGSAPLRLFSTMFMDGSRVLRLWRMFELPIILSSCPEKVDAEPVKLFLCLVMIPVTTTSSRLAASSFRVTTVLSCPVYAIRTSSMPSMEKMIVWVPSGMFCRVKFPYLSVSVPMVSCPSTYTTAPGSPFPASSLTTPISVLSRGGTLLS